MEMEQAVACHLFHLHARVRFKRVKVSDLPRDGIVARMVSTALIKPLKGGRF
jgi:hypothetical protein